MRRLSCLALLLGGILLSGCGDVQGSHTHTVTATVTDQTPAPAAAPTTTTSARVRLWYRRGLHSYGFESPTGNIRCGIDSDDHTQLLCKTLNNQKAVDLDEFSSLDTNWTVTLSAGNPTLAYGKMWWSANFVCWSEEDGTYCRSLYSRHGFKISRAGIEDWIWPKAILQLGGSDGGTYVIPGGSGYSVICNDGSISNSGGIQGACSWHGGVAP